jgi:integrase/recombinase XerC
VALRPAGSVRLLHPAEQTFEAMLDGWRNQQLARNLSFVTIASREAMVRRFHADTNEFPWVWTAAHVDEWFMDARAVRRMAHSTLRSYQRALRAFMAYLTDPAYDWPAACLERFGTHPVQICHECNTAMHVSECEARPARRALGRRELQGLFDLADSRVEDAAEHRTKGVLTAHRDAVMFKVAYGWGLRRNEVRMLDVTDFGVNPTGRNPGLCAVTRSTTWLPSTSTQSK